ncbi:MAG: nucleotidyltransferase domain-containing protein [Acidobacteria bacterium]|nr:nucleotidyltransferase domain-containing protein [Acidobacteriota bacterium]
MSLPVSQNFQEAVQAKPSLSKEALRRRRKQIQEVCRTIISNFHPEKITFFGSFAYGKPELESDVDWLIVMPYEGSPFRMASLILTFIVHSVGVLPIDLLVRSEQQISHRLKIGDSFIREILERGKVLYESDRA